MTRWLRPTICTRSVPKTLVDDLEEFFRNHRQHGGLTADATEPVSNGCRLTVGCACGVVFDRWATPADADVDLVRWVALN